MRVSFLTEGAGESGNRAVLLTSEEVVVHLDLLVQLSGEVLTQVDFHLILSRAD